MKLLLIFLALSSQAFGHDVSKAIIHPGEVRWTEFPATSDKSIFSCRGNIIKYAYKDRKGVAMVVESYFSELKPFKCLVEFNGKTEHEILFQVEDKEYKAEQLKVDPKKIKLAIKDEQRVWAEQQVLNRIYASSVKDFQFQKSFLQPLKSAITSVYGMKRVYNNQKKGQHLGIDYRAPIGEKVPATNGGLVVFAGDLFYTGWTVILDHGLDVFTVYGHLSQTLVPVGKKVERDEIIGLSGNTGRTSGPHLHWGVKIQGQYVDGMSLIDETQKHLPN